MPLLLLLFLLAAAPAQAEGERYGLASYLALAADYASGDRAPAVKEIRDWPPRVVRAAVTDLRGRSRQLRPVAASPGEIAFHSVEAAVLMHAEAGLLALEALKYEEAANHLGASVELHQWSLNALVQVRNWAGARERAFSSEPRPEIQPKIDSRDFWLALAAAALSVGSPTTAYPFAQRARQVAPLDAEVQLVYGCVAEGGAEERVIRQREPEATALRAEATRALMDAVALEDGLLEAHLHLGRTHLESGRPALARQSLTRVDGTSRDPRQRYLARLFLGHVAERRGRHDEAIGQYLRALEIRPDSQPASLSLAHALEAASGPRAGLSVVAASLSPPSGPNGAADPWRVYLFGPPGLASAALDQLWRKVVER